MSEYPNAMALTVLNAEPVYDFAQSMDLSNPIEITKMSADELEVASGEPPLGLNSTAPLKVPVTASDPLLAIARPSSSPPAPARYDQTKLPEGFSFDTKMSLRPALTSVEAALPGS